MSTAVAAGDVALQGDVRVLPLGQIAELRIGRTPSRSNPTYWSAGRFPWVSIGDMKNAHLATSKEHISEKALRDCFGGALVPKGTLLMSFKLSIGKLAILDVDAVHNEAIVGIYPDPVLADRDYIFYCLQSIDLDKDQDTYLKGKTLNKGKLALLPIPLPPLDEQRRIARILSAIHVANGATVRQLASVGALKRSLVADAFALDRYPTVLCSDVCEVLSVGIVVRPTQYYTNDGVIALRSHNVREDELDLKNTVRITRDAHGGPVAKSALRPGDVVIVRTGYPGTSAVIPEDLPEVNCIDLVFARPTRAVHPEYLSRFFNSPSGRAQALAAKTGMAQQHLNVGAVGRTQLPLPPLDVQISIIDRLRTIDAAFKALRSQAGSVNVLFDSALRHLMGLPI